MHAAPRASVWPSSSGRFLIIAGLTGFAISQPLLSILGDDPATLTFHGVQGRQLTLLAGLIAFVPPIALWGAIALGMLLDRRLGRALHLVVVATLVGVVAVQVAKSAGIEQRVVLVTAALGTGVAFAIAHVRSTAVATWATYTAILPVVACVFFLFASPSSALLTSVEAGPDRVDGAEADAPSVVVIVLDEFPTRSLMDEAGEIDGARFPNLAAFADQSTWYRHHTSFSAVTAAAVPSLVTGQLPSTDPPLWTSHPDSLFTLLAPTHELEVFESITTMCPYTSCVATATASDGSQQELDTGQADFGDLLDRTADLWVDRVTPGPLAPPALDDFAEEPESPRELEAASAPTGSVEELGGSSGEAVRSTSAPAQALIDSFDAAKGPALYYLHLVLPHQPWVRYPDGALYSVDDSRAISLPVDQRYDFAGSDWIGAVNEQRHLLQAQYTDRLVGQLVGALQEEGLYEGSLVIVTADHGISFEPRTGAREVTRSTIDALAYSPLLIKAPGQRTGVIDDSNVSAIDVVPTIADVLDLTIDWEVDGAPVGSAAIAARGDEKAIYDFGGLAKLTLEEILDYGDAETFASVARGWLGPLTHPADPISALNELLDLDGVIGAELDSLDPVDGGEVHIERLDDLERPPPDQFPLGLVTGQVLDAPANATLLLAVDGVVVGGSKLSTDADGSDGRIAVLVPQGVLERENDVRAALVVDGGVRELEVVGT